MAKKIINILAVLLGILSIILAFVTFGMNDGYHEGSYSYGGDAYTGIQNAAAQTANNLVYLSQIVKHGFGSVLLVFGIYLILTNISAVLEGVKKSAVFAAPSAGSYVPPAAPTYAPPAPPAAPVSEPPAAGGWTCNCGCRNEEGSNFCAGCGQPKA